MAAAPPNGDRVADTMALIDSRAAADTSETPNGDRVAVTRRRSDKAGRLPGLPLGNLMGLGSAIERVES